MPGGLTKEQSVLIKNFTNLSEKIEKCKSHIEFLKKCQSERVLPKGLNLTSDYYQGRSATCTVPTVEVEVS